MQTQTFESSSSSAVYTTQLDPTTRETSCNCPGWTKRVTNGARSCKHTKAMLAGAGAAPAVAPITAAVAPASAGCSFKPMLASAMTKGAGLDSLVGDPGWLLEEKYDGHRVIVRKAGPVVSAWSRPRSGSEALSRTLPAPVIEAVRQLPDGLYDGEIVSPGGRSWDVARLDTRATQVLVLFDVVELLGEPVASKPYTDRRALLAVAVAHHTKDAAAVRIIFPAAVPVTLEAVAEIWNRGGEGAILKRTASTYQPGKRSADWLKVKKVGAATLTITGFEAGKSGPYSTLALRGEDGKTTTVKTKDNATLAAITANPDSFIGRRLVISFCELTDTGSYRHGMFDHFAGPGE